MGLAISSEVDKVVAFLEKRKEHLRREIQSDLDVHAYGQAAGHAGQLKEVELILDWIA